MPSPAYNNLVKLISQYVDAKKASDVVERQLATCKLDKETLSTADLKTAAVRVATACSLYVSDSAKRDELKSKIMAL